MPKCHFNKGLLLNEHSVQDLLRHFSGLLPRPLRTRAYLRGLNVILTNKISAVHVKLTISTKVAIANYSGGHRHSQKL